MRDCGGKGQSETIIRLNGDGMEAEGVRQAVPEKRGMEDVELKLAGTVRPDLQFHRT